MHSHMLTTCPWKDMHCFRIPDNFGVLASQGIEAHLFFFALGFLLQQRPFLQQGQQMGT